MASGKARARRHREREREAAKRALTSGRASTSATGVATRRRCPCCGGPTTHVGTDAGIALISGCQWRVARWVREAL